MQQSILAAPCRLVNNSILRLCAADHIPYLWMFCMSPHQVPYLQQVCPECYRQAIDYLRALGHADGNVYVEEIAAMMQQLIDGVQPNDVQPTFSLIDTTQHHEIGSGAVQKLRVRQRLRFQLEQDQC